MSSNNRPRLPRTLALPPPENLFPVPRIPPSNGSGPSNVVEPRGHQRALQDQRVRRDPTPAIIPTPVPQVLPQHTEAAVEGRPAKRRTPLLPAPAGERVPAFQEYNRREPGMTTGKRKRRDGPSCRRCRDRKYGCCGGEPQCGNCVIAGTECIYEPTQHQTEQAQGRTEFRFRQYRPRVESIPAAIPGPRLLQFLEPLTTGYGELAPGSAQQRQDPEIPRSLFETSAAAPEAEPQLPEGYSQVLGGYAAGSPGQQDHPQRSGLMFDDNGNYRGYTPGFASQQDYSQGFGLCYRDNTSYRGYAPGFTGQEYYPQESGPGSGDNAIYGGYTPGSTSQRDYPQEYGLGSGHNDLYGGYELGSAGQQDRSQGFGLGCGYNDLYGGYAPGSAGQQDHSQGYGLGLRILDSRSTQNSQQPQGHNTGYGGFRTVVNDGGQRPRIRDSVVQQPDTEPYRYQQNPQQPLWNVEEFRRRQRDTVQGTQQPAFDFGGYQPTPTETSSVLGGYQPASSEPSPLVEEPMLASRESSALHGSSSYARAPGMEFDGTSASSFGNTQSSNEPEMMSVFDDFAQPGQDGGHDARGSSLDEAWDAAIDYDADRTP